MPLFLKRRSRRALERRSHVPELGEEHVEQRFFEERHAGAAAGAALEADDALDGGDVAEAPKLEALFDVDELLAHVVSGPVLGGVFVDALEDCDDLVTRLVRLREVSLEMA